MTYTAKDLEKMLSANPDLCIIGVVNDNALAAMARVAQMPKMSERQMQASVIEECDRRAVTNVDWGMVVACPNGQYRPGQRMEPGLRAGFPDLMVLLPRLKGNVQRHGLFLELKVEKNGLTSAQELWLRKLRVEGYVCEVVRDDPQEAIEILEWWIEG